MAMVEYELAAFNEREVVWMVRYDSATRRVAEFGCFNKSDHVVSGTLTRPSGLMDAQAEFLPNQNMATWILIRNGMDMEPDSEDPNYLVLPYSPNLMG